MPGRACRSRSVQTRHTCSAVSSGARPAIALFDPGHRHPAGGAEGAGRAPACVVRRTVDHGVFDLFEENITLLPCAAARFDAEDPVEVLARGRDPALWRSCGCTTARSTAGTVRYTTSSAAKPHLRVENRVLPAGPTVVDVLANAALLLRLCCDRSASRNGRCGRRCPSEPPRTTSTRAPGTASTRQIYWPGTGEVPATELVLRRLLPLAHQGLAAWGVDSSVSDRLLGVIEGRCTGWPQRRRMAGRALPPDRRGAQPLDRRDALRGMTRRTLAYAHQRAGAHLARRRLIAQTYC